MVKRLVLHMTVCVGNGFLLNINIKAFHYIWQYFPQTLGGDMNSAFGLLAVPVSWLCHRVACSINACLICISIINSISSIVFRLHILYSHFYQKKPVFPNFGSINSTRLLTTSSAWLPLTFTQKGRIFFSSNFYFNPFHTEDFICSHYMTSVNV